MQCAKTLNSKGLSCTILEKGSAVGGHVAEWHTCYPFDLTGTQITDTLAASLPNTQIVCNAAVADIRRTDGNFAVASGNTVYNARAVVIATGYNLFDATIKEELGYKVYPRVITSADLEAAWKNGKAPFDVSDTDTPRFAIVHCVGSRDLKCNATHCSKVCCMAAVKAATELKRHYPNCQVTNYYMDLRMFDTGYEELYHSAQVDSNVQFVRGRVSEVSLGNMGRVKLKSEDTLLGIPVADRVHGMVLMIGMQPSAPIAIDGTQLDANSNGFVAVPDKLNANATAHPGIFTAGACKGPKNITETLSDAQAAACAAEAYLKQK